MWDDGCFVVYILFDICMVSCFVHNLDVEG